MTNFKLLICTPLFLLGMALVALSLIRAEILITLFDGIYHINQIMVDRIELALTNNVRFFYL